MDRHTRIAEHPRLVGQRDKRNTLPGHHEPRARAPQGPSAEECQLRGHRAVLDDYVSALRQRAPGRGVRRLQRLLALKREYPPEPFYAAVEQALAFGLFDRHRLEQMILERVAGDFFDLDDD